MGPGTVQSVSRGRRGLRRVRCSVTSIPSSSRCWTRPASGCGRSSGPANALTFPVSGTGSAGMEAAFVNLVRPGDVVVVGVNGLFGQRMCEVARRLGAEVVAVEAPWGEPLDPDAVLAAHPSPAMIAVVHAETSTGVRNDVGADGAGQGRRPSPGRHGHVARGHRRRGGRAGGSTSPTAGRRSVSAYPRALAADGGAPGPGQRIVETAVLVVLRPRPACRGYVEVARAVAPTTTRRRCPWCSPCTPGSGSLLEEGLEASWARHEACGRLLQDGLETPGSSRWSPRPGTACRS